MRRYILFIALSLLYTQITFAQSGWMQSNIGTAKLTSINFIDENTGYIFGWLNQFYKTTDRGETWKEYSTSDWAFSGSFIDDRIGIFVGLYPYITTDGGANWVYGSGITPIPGSSGAAIFLRSGLMINKDTGFAVGSEFGFMGSTFYVVNKIYRTTNSGQLWELVNMSGDIDWYDIRIDKNNKLYCVWGSLVTSTDYGETWNHVSNTFQSVFSMSEIFGDTVYLSAYRGRILKSFNGGLNWSLYQAPTADSLNKVFFIDNKTGWVAGDSGYILRTTNSGTDWTKQNTPTTTDINSIYFINKDTGFAVGDNGLFLKTYTGGTVGIESISTSVPERYILHQNYPNPFNPSTIIRFEITRSEAVKLSVYDLAGKEVAVLVNKPLNTGVYEYDFKAEGLASGIYFYKLETGSFIDTKRMVLIK